jgi:predicted site-specific integrase-resolvase
MVSLFPKAEIIFDIGSGLNFKRKGLKTLLERLMRRDQFTLVVAYGSMDAVLYMVKIIVRYSSTTE